jgi:hypothetical protein
MRDKVRVDSAAGMHNHRSPETEKTSKCGDKGLEQRQSDGPFGLLTVGALQQKLVE